MEHWLLETFYVRILCFGSVLTFSVPDANTRPAGQPSWFKPEVNDVEAVAES